MTTNNAINTTNLAAFTASSVVGNPTGSPAAVSAITLGAALAFSGSTLKVSGGLINIQAILSSSTYTPTAGATNGIVFCVGGGGGAGGSGSSGAGDGGIGGTTSFGAICSATGGAFGQGSALAGDGGIGSNGTLNLQGGGGAGGSTNDLAGGSGGCSFFGGARRGVSGASDGLPGIANSGGGGSGGGTNTTFASGGGGGGAGCAIKFVSGLASTSCTIGAGGTAGGAGVGGNVGGAGGSGVILILEFA